MKLNDYQERQLRGIRDRWSDTDDAEGDLSQENEDIAYLLVLVEELLIALDKEEADAAEA